MRTVFKFTHSVAEKIELEVHAGANLVKVSRDTRNPDDLAFWFELDSSETEKDDLTFYTVGTGHSIPPYGVVYVDTIQIGYFIWHIYRG